MSNERTKTIPFLFFSAHPSYLKEYLIEKDCFNRHTKTVMRELLDQVNLDETIKIHDVDPYAGITNHVSANWIAQESGIGLRNVQFALAELREKEVIEVIGRTATRKIPKYKLNVYQPAHDFMQANPNHPKCQVSIMEAPAQAQAAHANKAKATYAANTQDHAAISYNLEKEDLQDSPSSQKSTGPRGNEGRNEGNKNEVEKQGNEKGTAKGSGKVEQGNQERRQSEGSTGSQRQRPSPSSASESPDARRDNQGHQAQGKGIDTIPNNYIGKEIDKLTKEKSMSAAPTAHDTEAFLLTFRPAQHSVIATETEHRLVQELKRFLDDIAPKTPPLSLFKRCVKEVNRRLEHGILTEPPKSITFFYKTDWGKEIIQYCVDQENSENRAQSSIEKTDSYLDDLKERRANPAPIPANVQAELDKMLGRTSE